MMTRCSTLLVVHLFVRSVFAAAWWPEGVVSPRSLPFLQNPSASFSRAIQKFRPENLKATQQVDDETGMVPPDINPKLLIQINSEVKLPFSPEVAFDAYSDLTRQPLWSSWLHSVEYIDEEKKNSKWTMQFLKVKYSWTAIALRNQRPRIIQWQSTSGLQNFGTVEFIPHDDEQYPTLMTMKMAFVAPRAAAAVFRRSKFMANFVREKMILDSMLNFRNVVLKTDCKEGDS